MEKNRHKTKEYRNKISKAKYRHLEKHGSGRMKYYYTLGRGAGTSHHPSILKSNISKQGAECVRKKMKNPVFITMKTGSTYEGELNSRGERHGYGIYRVIFAGRYEGSWRNGFKHGQGTSYYKSGGIQYQGAWEGGEPHGIGVIFDRKGELLYEGEWKNGKNKQRKYLKDYRG